MRTKHRPQHNAGLAESDSDVHLKSPWDREAVRYLNGSDDSGSNCLPLWTVQKGTWKEKGDKAGAMSPEDRGPPWALIFPLSVN